ncbi:hypothetical protein SDC9_133175 [bioreactor metagenome]|uniref:SHSP domain-containing protein n=1 Tax=bioreactor metagenome TaxID=1076179 RepID=A0A645DBZ0_9ZZZZ
MLPMLKNRQMTPTLRGLDDVFDAVLSKLDPFFDSEELSEFGNFSKLDVSVTDNAVAVKLPLPGYDGKDIVVEIEQDMLHVRGERKIDNDRKNKEGKVIRRERTTSSFSQSVKLPVAVKGAEAKAAYRDGVLTVTMPREGAGKSHAVKVD